MSEIQKENKLEKGKTIHDKNIITLFQNHRIMHCNNNLTQYATVMNQDMKENAEYRTFKKVKQQKKFKLNRNKLLNHLNFLNDNKSCDKVCSMPVINPINKVIRKKCAREIDKNNKPYINPYRSRYTVNMVSEYFAPNNIIHFKQKNWKVYRCQFNTAEESCCCSCNSDAMFEVMKSLYDCYKRKNCDNCNCILCGHLPREKRKISEKRKAEGENLLLETGQMTILEDKTPKEKEKALQEMAMTGMALPEGKTSSNKKLIAKVRKDLGLPPEPTLASDKSKYNKAMAEGIVVPLEGKTALEKENILRAQYEAGLTLPKGRTKSEKSLIAKIRAKTRSQSVKPSINSQTKVKDLINPLEGKTPEQKERILKAMAQKKMPLPLGKSNSDKILIDRVRANLGLPPEPVTEKDKRTYIKALTAGIITPLAGKTHSQKRKILKAQQSLGIPLPKGRTLSENALITEINAKPKIPYKSDVSIPAEKLKEAMADGILSPFSKKSPAEKEKALKLMAKKGIPFPEGDTPSNKNLIRKVRNEIGLPPKPKTDIDRKKYNKALAAGIIFPLDGKSPEQKEKILKAQHALGIHLPVGRTPSEKILIAKTKALPTSKMQSSVSISPEKLKKAMDARVLSPLAKKSPEDKEKSLRNMVLNGYPLPEGETSSEKRLIDKIRKDVGLPPIPKTSKDNDQYKRAMQKGLVTPLEGKTKEQKEKALRGQHQAQIQLPEGRTPSEKALIAKIKAEPSAIKSQNSKISTRISPLEGKSKEHKEKLLKKMAIQGVPLPEGKTRSDKKLINKVIADLGLPPEAKIPEERIKYNKAVAAGIIMPIEGKTPQQKEKILKAQQALGIPLPEGRTASEKALIEKIKMKPKLKLQSDISIPPDKLRKAMAAGIISPLAKKSPVEKEKTLKNMAMNGIPLPEGDTPSEKKLIEKVLKDLGLPPTPKTSAEKSKYIKAIQKGLFTPLEGKTPTQKKEILRAQHQAHLSLPEGRTSSEKSLIAKIKAEPQTPSIEGKGKAIYPLQGKTAEEKRQVLKAMAKKGQILPEGKSHSDKKLIDKVRKDLGLPPELKSMKDLKKQEKARAAGIITPLDNKTPSQKKKILQAQHALGISLPIGRTPSEKALIAAIQASPNMPMKSNVSIPAKILKEALAAGILSPFDRKSPADKEKALRFMAMNGFPLPIANTPSLKKLIDKVRNDVGLPPEPLTEHDRNKYDKALAAAVVSPLEGKTTNQKEKTLKAQHALGIPLPTGRTPSEKALIAKIKAMSAMKLPSGVSIPPEKLKKAMAAGVLSPFAKKSPAEKEKALRQMAMNGIPLPEGATPSETKLIDKVRNNIGLPPAPKSPKDKEKYKNAIQKGLLTPLEGKTPQQKENVLRAQHQAHISLPEGRTPSEKALIAQITAEPRAPSVADSEKERKSRAGLPLSPLDGKTPEEKKKILKAMVKRGILLPEGKSPSDKNIINKVRNDLGLPPEPKSKNDRIKYEKATAAGIITPLEGKSPAEKQKILKAQQALGLPLPIGRTPSEKALIAAIQASPNMPMKSNVSIPAKILKEALAVGVLSPFDRKSPADKEKALRFMAMNGFPLPIANTPSLKKLIDKVRNDVGLPPEPLTEHDRNKYDKALAAAVVSPLEGKTTNQKEKTLKAQHALGIPLPTGRTPSEKALIAKIKAMSAMKLPSGVSIPPEKLKKAMAAGVLSPFAKKSPAEKEKALRQMAMNGIPLPEGATPSETKLIDKVRNNIGLPPAPKSPKDKEKYKNAIQKGLLTPLEGKTPQQKENVLRAQHQAHISLPEGRTPSEKALIAQITAEPRAPSVADSEKERKSRAGLPLSPLDGKTPEEKKKILKIMANRGVPLPEGKSQSEKNLIDRLRKELGLPPEPKSENSRTKYEKAAAAGIISPLEGKTPAQKKNILGAQQALGIHLPEGRTHSEKALIASVKAIPKLSIRSDISIPAETLKKALAAGILSPFDRKNPADKEKALRFMAMNGFPLPIANTPSLKKLIDKVRNDVGLPPEPLTEHDRNKYDKALAAAVVSPLEGKTTNQKEKTLKAQHALGIPLPTGRTPSEKALIAKIKAMSAMKLPSGVSIPPEKLKKAMAAGVLSPFAKKSPAEKEKALRQMAMGGIPLPEGATPSEKKLIDKVRKNVGLPPAPKSPKDKEKYKNAIQKGLLTPLEGKTPQQKENVLRAQHQAHISLPEGRTPSEKALIAKIQSEPHETLSATSEKYRKSKAGLPLSPLDNKTPEKKEKILKAMANRGIPFPEGKSPSDKNLFNKVRHELGLPPEPITKADRKKYEKAAAAGIVAPLEGKSPAQKQKILKAQQALGLPLPIGRTPSEKALIAAINVSPKIPIKSNVSIPAEKLKEALAAGVLSPFDKKSPAEKEKSLRFMAMNGFPLPIGNTISLKKLIDKVRNDLGLPPEPQSEHDRNKYDKALAAGVVFPLEGKTPDQKEKTLKAQQALGITLPTGRTASEKALIAQIKAMPTMNLPSGVSIPSDKLKKAMATGMLSPLAKKSYAEKEKALQQMAMGGIPLPEGATPSEKKLIDKVRNNVGLPPAPKSPKDKERYEHAIRKGLLSPLEGKTRQQKENLLRAQHQAHILIPEGGRPSEKALVAKIRASPLEDVVFAPVVTRLDGKTPKEKIKILRKLADAGLPLPEGKSVSEKSVIQKVKAEYRLSPELRSPSKQEIRRKAKAEGLLTPLAGKTKHQKSKIIRGLAQAGLPIPEGVTASEKDIINEIRTDFGLPLKSTTSEKLEKIKRIDRKVGIPGVKEEIEKLTTCDRACGCDKKKIKFKHSYIKIKVISPDLSSLCSCSEECIPRVRHGVITDNEGIKVTVGNAIGVPYYGLVKPLDNFNVRKFNPATKNNHNINNISTKVPRVATNSITHKNNILNYHDKANASISYMYTDPETKSLTFIYIDSTKQMSEKNNSVSSLDKMKSSENINSSCSTFNNSISASMSLTSITKSANSTTSFPYVMSIKSELYSSLRTYSVGHDALLSVISIEANYLSSITTFESNRSSNESANNGMIYRTLDKFNSISNLAPAITGSSSTQYLSENHRRDIKNNKCLYTNNSPFKLSNKRKSKQPTELFGAEYTRNLIVLMSTVQSNYSIRNVIDKMLSQNSFSESSIYLIVPSSDDRCNEDICDDLNSVNRLHSLICIQDSTSVRSCCNHKSQCFKDIRDVPYQNLQVQHFNTIKEEFKSNLKQNPQTNVTKALIGHVCLSNQTPGSRSCHCITEAFRTPALITRHCSPYHKQGMLNTKEPGNNIPSIPTTEIPVKDFTEKYVPKTSNIQNRVMATNPHCNACNLMHITALMPDIDSSPSFSHQESVRSSAKSIGQCSSQSDSITLMIAEDSNTEDPNYSEEIDTGDSTIYLEISNSDEDDKGGCGLLKNFTNFTNSYESKDVLTQRLEITVSGINTEDGSMCTCQGRPMQSKTDDYQHQRKSSNACCVKEKKSDRKGKQIPKMKKWSSKDSSKPKAEIKKINVDCDCNKHESTSSHIPMHRGADNNRQEQVITISSDNMIAVKECNVDDVQGQAFEGYGTVNVENVPIKLSVYLPPTQYKVPTSTPVGLQTQPEEESDGDDCYCDSNNFAYTTDKRLAPEQSPQLSGLQLKAIPRGKPCPQDKQFQPDFSHGQRLRDVKKKSVVEGTTQTPRNVPREERCFVDKNLNTNDLNKDVTNKDSGNKDTKKKDTKNKDLKNKITRKKDTQKKGSEPKNQISHQDCSCEPIIFPTPEQPPQKLTRKEKKELKRQKKMDQDLRKKMYPKRGKNKLEEMTSGLEIDYGLVAELIDEKNKADRTDIMQRNSDTTQTISGFKFKFVKKSQSISSFEDAVRYIEQHPEEFYEPNENVDCQCGTVNSGLKGIFKKNQKCECTPEPNIEEPPFSGFKIAVGGKGSGSKGLSGVCCFDLYQEQPLGAIANVS